MCKKIGCLGCWPKIWFKGSKNGHFMTINKPRYSCRSETVWPYSYFYRLGHKSKNLVFFDDKEGETINFSNDFILIL